MANTTRPSDGLPVTKHWRDSFLKAMHRSQARVHAVDNRLYHSCSIGSPQQPNDSPAINLNAFRHKALATTSVLTDLAGLVVSRSSGGCQPSALSAARKLTTCCGRLLRCHLPQPSVPPRALYMMHCGSRTITPATPPTTVRARGRSCFRSSGMAVHTFRDRHIRSEEHTSELQ